MISFEQARQIALNTTGPIWEPNECGDYVVADYGSVLQRPTRIASANSMTGESRDGRRERK